jgi:hypothetical protein
LGWERREKLGVECCEWRYLNTGMRMSELLEPLQCYFPLILKVRVRMSLLLETILVESRDSRGRGGVVFV